jgi:hypothetical protein
MGIGDWGLGIGPIPNPHFELYNNLRFMINFFYYKFFN